MQDPACEEKDVPRIEGPEKLAYFRHRDKATRIAGMKITLRTVWSGRNELDVLSGRRSSQINDTRFPDLRPERQQRAVRAPCHRGHRRLARHLRPNHRAIFN